MTRSESYSEGRVPLHTIRADIDYGFAEAKTTSGRIGVKVWINKGEIMPEGYGRLAAATRGSATRIRRAAGRPEEGLGASREGGRGARAGPRGPRPRAPAPARPSRAEAGGGGAGRVVPAAAAAAVARGQESATAHRPGA